MNARRTAVLAAILVAACGDDATSAIDAVVVEGEPGLGLELDLVRLTIVRLEGEAAGRVHEIDPDYVGGRLQPTTVRLLPELASDPGRTLYRVRAEGLVGEDVVVRAQHRVTFVPGKTLTVVLRFEGSCRDVTCEGDATCEAGVCVDDFLPTCPLLGDGDACDGAADAGARDAADGETPPDADDDAGPTGDAGADAGCAARETSCDGGDDEDCDGTRDCADTDCADDPACGACAAVECPACERCIDGACVVDDGAACTGGTCAGGRCCRGCIADDGTCVAPGATGDGACGTAGEACDVCSECESCDAGDCAPRPDGSTCADGRCRSGACCTGCWDVAGGACMAGGAIDACGRAGRECVTCECAGECTGDHCRVTGTVTSVAAGHDHTCALAAGGELYCWGFNGVFAVSTPTRVGTTTYTQIANGLRPDDGSRSHRCAVGADGLSCWGGNTHGELGLDDRTSRGSPIVADGSSWSMTAVGGGNSCAIREGTGDLYCWGYNGEGRVGLGSSGGDVLLPTLVAAGSAWSSVAVGEAHSFGIRPDGSLWAWGNDAFSRLGNGAGPRDVYAPERIAAEQGWAHVSAGSRHACAIERVTGALYCWGWNETFELGLGPTMDARDDPTLVSVDAWTAVSAGAGFTCAIRVGGQLHCWGANDDGRLGLGDTVSRNVPSLVESLDGWTQVSAGQSHTCAMRADGRLYCFGSNASSQLGRDSSTPSSTRPLRVCF